jgi:hypothetical protein
MRLSSMADYAVVAMVAAALLRRRKGQCGAYRAENRPAAPTVQSW